VIRHTPARALAKGDTIISYGLTEIVKRVEQRETTVLVRTNHHDHTYALDKLIKVKS
jgi:hypothetical protein